MDNLVEPHRPAWSRPESVFVAASLALLAGLLVPVSPAVLAILWVCVLCLAGAVTMICLAAGNSADLVGFVPLMSGLTLLRLAALAAAARRIIAHLPADPVLGTTGAFLAGKWPLGAVLICLVLAVIVSVVVFAAGQKILLASSGYIGRILPLKRIGIETDVRMGVIDEEQARTLARRIVSEFRFFAGMQGVGTLIRGEIAIVVLVLLACVLLGMLTGPAEASSGPEFMAQTIPPVVGLAILTLIPLVTAAAACGAMMGRDTLTLRSEKEQTEPTPAAKKISIVTRDTGEEEEVELLNPDFVGNGGSQERIADFEPLGEADWGSGEQTAKTTFQRELEALEEKADVAAEWACRSAEEYYEKLSRMILAQERRHVVLAAETLGDLPVTVAVNVAIRLAQKHKKILLVDTDPARNALARVFDLDPQMLVKKVLGTCFENLSVCTVPAAKINKLLAKTEALRSHEMLLIYAPQCAGLEIRCAEPVTGFYFSAGRGFETFTRAAPIHAAVALK